MLEDAYQVRDYVDYYVASENPKFAFETPHFQAVSSVTAATTPAQLAALFTTTYADACNVSPPYPCTMSTVDISELHSVVTSTNSLAQLLNGQMVTAAITLTTIISGTVQRFEMNGDDVINLSDSYIDLYDFAHLVKENFSDSSLQAAAQAVMNTISEYTTTEYHKSGTFEAMTETTTWNLDNSHGVSIFFPPTASSFYRASNYDFATGANWPGVAGLSLNNNQATIDWGPMLVSYFRITQPTGPDNPTPPQLLPLLHLHEYRVYLPVIIRW